MKKMYVLSFITCLFLFVSTLYLPTSFADVGDTRQTATTLTVGTSRTEAINPDNDIDYFSVQINQTGQLTVWTTGSLDTVGRLENSAGTTLAENDDGGSSANFSITLDVEPGTYYVRVRGYGGNTGNYTVHAAFEAEETDTSTDVNGGDVDTGNIPSIFRGHTDDVLSVSFSPDGTTIASGSWDKTIRLWNANTGDHISTLRGHTDMGL